MAVTRQDLILMNPTINGIINEIKIDILTCARNGCLSLTKTYGAFSEKIANYIVSRLKEIYTDLTFTHYEDIQTNTRVFQINWEPL